MIEGYIFETRDVNERFLAYFIVHESDKLKAEQIVKNASMAESVTFVKELNKDQISNWRTALKDLPIAVSYDLAKGKCMDLATWVHSN